MQTYRTNEAAIQDKADLGLLLVTLNASPATLRRNEDGLWVLRGARGYCSTWGDQKSWQLVVNEMSSALAWAWAEEAIGVLRIGLGRRHRRGVSAAPVAVDRASGRNPRHPRLKEAGRVDA